MENSPTLDRWHKLTFILFLMVWAVNWSLLFLAAEWLPDGRWVEASLPILAGYCYTQFADTYQEANGLLDSHRTPKIPIETIALATRGPRTQKDRQMEWMWRERLMNSQRHQYMVPSEDYQTQEHR